MKLIKVSSTLYRNESGNVLAMHQLKHRGKPAHWLLTWKGFLGHQYSQEFTSLKALRQYIKTSGLFN